MNNEEFYIKRCLQLAENGLGRVSPNPLVGCVVVSENEIIGEGFHQQYGSSHAEPNALHSIKKTERIKGSTLYVNLEPCSHFGKTPPCVQLIIDKGIKKVIICNVDPNPLVSGKGIGLLQSKGIEVVTSILEKEGRNINRRFFTFMEKKRPYIILKWAQTLDGFMDIQRNQGNSDSYWITNKTLQILNHKWRSEEDAIMVGTQTAVNDNPQLTTRLWSGKNPTRIVLDHHLRLNSSLHLFNQKAATLVYTSQKKESKENLIFIQIPFFDLLSEILEDLYNRGIQSVIIEGGFQLLSSFIEQNIWDEARILIGNRLFINGLKAPSLPIKPIDIIEFENDKLLLYTNSFPTF